MGSGVRTVRVLYTVIRTESRSHKKSLIFIAGVIINNFLNFISYLLQVEITSLVIHQDELCVYMSLTCLTCYFLCIMIFLSISLEHKHG